MKRRPFKLSNWKHIDGETLSYFMTKHRHKTDVMTSFPGTATFCEACREVLDVLESLTMEGS